MVVLSAGLALTACHSRLTGITPMQSVVCWRDDGSDKLSYRAQAIIDEVLAGQGEDDESIANRRIFGKPKLRGNQARPVTRDSECARVAAALGAALRSEHLVPPPMKRVAAARLGRFFAIQVDEPGIATVHILDGMRRVGGWSGP